MRRLLGKIGARPLRTAEWVPTPNAKPSQSAPRRPSITAVKASKRFHQIAALDGRAHWLAPLFCLSNSSAARLFGGYDSQLRPLRQCLGDERHGKVPFIVYAASSLTTSVCNAGAHVPGSGVCELERSDHRSS